MFPDNGFSSDLLVVFAHVLRGLFFALPFLALLVCA